MKRTVINILVSIGVSVTAIVIYLAIGNIVFALPGDSVSADDPRPDAEEFIEEIKKAGLLQKVVKSLIREGEICAVRGHLWEPGCGYIGCAVIHTSEMRYCAICGKTETMEP